MAGSVDETSVLAVKALAEQLSFTCNIFYHPQSGKSTDEAEQALGVDRKYILKCLLLRSKRGEFLGAIIRGCDTLDVKVLEGLSGYKELRFAKPEEVFEMVGFEVGGVPAIIFYERGIVTYVDERLLELEFVIGAGGTPFYGMKFHPRLLVERLHYTPATIAKPFECGDCHEQA